MYVGLYHGTFGLLLALVAGSRIAGHKIETAGSAAAIRRALVAAPFLWVAIELARTRITAFPWELLGYSQTGNFALTRIATLTGVYGLSFEILLVNSVFAAAFLVPKKVPGEVPKQAPKERRKWLLAAA
jgi:apolipoprotein N-acyltransferase